MTTRERYNFVITYFQEHNPEASTELEYTDPYQLVVAVILSAQCTDKRVNMITPAFFESFPTAESLAKAEPPQVFELIKSCSYPNNKAKNLVGMARGLVNDYHGTLPSDVDELQKLPGVGRKTANVLASVIYSKPAMAVDTHVHRVSARIGLTVNAKNPLQTERQLVKHIPESLIPLAHHWLILHGRYVCVARKPKCDSMRTNPGLQIFQKHAEILNLVNKSCGGTVFKPSEFVNFEAGKNKNIMATLKPGDKAPDIKATDQDGNPVSLKAFKGSKVILYFYPKDDTPGCTAEACNLRDNYALLMQKGFKIMGFQRRW